MPRGTVPDRRSSAPVPAMRPCPPTPPPGDPPALAGSFGSVFCGVSVPFPSVLVCARFCLCTSVLESLFPPVLWKSYNQLLLVFQFRFHEDSLCRAPNLGSPSVTLVLETGSLRSGCHLGHLRVLSQNQTTLGTLRGLKDPQ